MQLLDDDEPAAAPAEAAGPKVYERYTFTWAEHEKDDGASNLGRTFRAARSIGSTSQPRLHHDRVAGLPMRLG
ncbi:MAG: hypothetical protein R3F65_22100 [bacterium]